MVVKQTDRLTDSVLEYWVVKTILRLVREFLLSSGPLYRLVIMTDHLHIVVFLTISVAVIVVIKVMGVSIHLRVVDRVNFLTHS